MANLHADGLSMSVACYHSQTSEQDTYERELKNEEWEIDNLPDVEKKEIEDIYRLKGFEGEELRIVVNRITSNRQVWLDTMMKDELGLSIDTKSPFFAGFSTFIAFVVAGSVPLFTYLFTYSGLFARDPFVVSSILTALAFILIGYVKSSVTKSSRLRGVGETLLLGVSAALVAYFVGDVLEQLLL
jgi:VIT1/CCC1 family predicted Fe2+/Mn2+ transporter